MTSHRIREHTSKEDAQQIEKFKCNICNKELLKCTCENCDQTCVNAGTLKKHIEWHKDIGKKRKRKGRIFKKTKAAQ